MVAWVQSNYPNALPRTRITVEDAPRVAKAAKK